MGAVFPWPHLTRAGIFIPGSAATNVLDGVGGSPRLLPRRARHVGARHGGASGQLPEGVAEVGNAATQGAVERSPRPAGSMRWRGYSQHLFLIVGRLKHPTGPPVGTRALSSRHSRGQFYSPESATAA